MKQFLFLLICVVCFANYSDAQKFTKISSSGGVVNYSVIDPADGTPWLGVPTPGSAPIAGSGTPASLTCFIEFGDGTFSFDPTGTHVFGTSLSNKDICTKFTGVYGGGGKPPKHAMAAKVDPVLGSPYIPMILLGLTEQVHITPNISSVLEKDTMIFVVTYKLKDNQKNGNLLFLFNNNTIFENYTIGITFNNVNTGGNDVSFERTYFGERETTSLSANAGTQKTINAIYKNVIAFDKLKNDSYEHNIFITLIPKAGITTAKFSKTLLKAILVFDNFGENLENSEDSKPVVSETSNELNVVDKSHDPNYINVDPVCMLLPKENHKIDYHLHFQNTGIGGASRVRVAIKTPEGVNIANDIAYTHSGGWYKIINGAINNTAPYSNATGDSLIFDFIKNTSMSGASATLDGMSLTPSATNNNKTTGDVWFTINSTNALPSILLAQASIVFFNASDGSVNEPIITNTAVTQFRECCDCENKCDKCKNKGKLWRWLFCKKC